MLFLYLIIFLMRSENEKSKFFAANILVIIIILLSGCSADISSGASGIDNGVLDLTARDKE